MEQDIERTQTAVLSAISSLRPPRPVKTQQPGQSMVKFDHRSGHFTTSLSTKRPLDIIDVSSASPPASPGSSLTGSGGYSHFAPSTKSVLKKSRQTKMWEQPVDPEAALQMDIALTTLKKLVICPDHRPSTNHMSNYVVGHMY